MEKSDIEVLREFLSNNKFSGFDFRSEDQPRHSMYEPLRYSLSFNQILMHEFPDAILLKGYDGSVQIDRLKRIFVEQAYGSPVVEIVLISECGGFDAAKERVYKIRARKLLRKIS